MSHIQETRNFFRKVYAWMCAGLILSGGTAYYVSLKPEIYEWIFMTRWAFYALMIVEIGLVVGLAAAVKKISAHTAMFLFLLYSFVSGLTLSVIFLVFELSSIVHIFFLAAGMFAFMSVYGFFTKKDLTGWGPTLYMGLFGIIGASLLNFFFKNGTVDLVISIIGVLVFTGLTAHDTQKIKKNNVLGNEGTPEDMKEAIIGALDLYLDFVNLFLDLLRILGKKK